MAHFDSTDEERPPRFNVSLPITVREDIIDSPKITGMVSKDISKGGLAIEIHNEEVSSRLLDGRLAGLWIEIQLPGAPRPEMVMARKVWGKELEDGGYLGGFRFFGFAEDAQQRIYDYLADLYLSTLFTSEDQPSSDGQK